MLEVAGREVAISNPARSTSPRPASPSSTSCATTSPSPRARCAARAAGRTCSSATPNGIHGEFFYQKRAPASRPDWIEVVALRFPSGRTAEEVVPRDAAALAWMANLGCLELHPHPVRAEDLDHPDELRIDLDPVPGVEWSQLAGRGPASCARCWRDLGLVGWPKTSGSRGIHVNVRIHRRWSFTAGAARRAGAGARGRAARARRSPPASGGRRSATASSSTTTRTPRTARSPAPTRCARSPTRASPRRSPGTSSASAGRRTSRCARCRRASPRSATATPASTSSPCSLEPLLELSARAGGGGPRRRAVAAALREAGRASRRASSRRGRGASATPAAAASRRSRSSRSAAARRKEDALAGLERWKARHPEAAAHLQPADVLVDAMRGRSSTWTRVRVNLEHVPEALRPAAGAARSGRPASRAREPRASAKIAASSAGGVTSSWS